MARGVFVANNALTAASLNDCFDPPRVRVRNSADITISNNIATKLTFNTEDFDVGGMHSTSTNTGRLTVPTGGGGTYLVGATIAWDKNATGGREMEFKLNNTTYICADWRNNAGAGYFMWQSMSTLVQLVAGDYIETEVEQYSGGNLICKVVNGSPSFWATWVGI